MVKQEGRWQRRSMAGVEQDELVDPRELGDEDSCFFELNGVLIHHKICHHEDFGGEAGLMAPPFGVSGDDKGEKAPPFGVSGDDKGEKEPPLGVSGDSRAAKIGLPMILLHGFAASVFSWEKVIRPLARIVGSKVLAFDRPAFGLTSRVSSFGQSWGGDARPLNPYSTAFSVLATLSFVDMLGTGKAILMGHSAGCLVAVKTYFEAPEEVAALILVAPAIVAPLVLRRGNKDGDDRSGNGVQNGNLVIRENPFARIWQTVVQMFMWFMTMMLRMLQAIHGMLMLLYHKTLSAVLRSPISVMLVRTIIDKFGVLVIRNSWYDASQVTDYVLTGYTKPLKVKGWDTALLEFTLALLMDSASKQSLSQKLSQISCPVLIITGDTDRLVPAWNAKRLSKAIPGSAFEVIRNCGHLPHEEKVEEFLAIVERFLSKTFGDPSRQLAKAVAR